jgi:DNA-binding transcriptional MocR family regulator
VGYLVGPQAVIKQIQTIATNTYISPNMVAQSIVNQFARSGRMDGAVATVKAALRERRDAVCAALERELPEARFARPQGGYFMWVELPEEVDVAELEKAAAQREVRFVKGTDFLLDGGRNTLRLAYSGVTPEQIDEGITRLAEAVRSLGVATA